MYMYRTFLMPGELQLKVACPARIPPPRVPRHCNPIWCLCMDVPFVEYVKFGQEGTSGLISLCSVLFPPRF